MGSRNRRNPIITISIAFSLMLVVLSGQQSLDAYTEGFQHQSAFRNNARSRHAWLKERLTSDRPARFLPALDTLNRLDEPGVLALWQSALTNADGRLRREAWALFDTKRNQLSRNEFVPQVVRVDATAAQLQSALNPAQFETQVWRQNNGETVAALTPYAVRRLEEAGFSFTVLYDTIAAWQSARSAGDPAAKEITPDYQSDAGHEVRIAVIDREPGSRPLNGYSDWLGDHENIVLQSNTAIAYLDIFQTDGSPESIALHIQERYTKRGYRVRGFFRPDEFSRVVGQFFPGQSFGSTTSREQSDVRLSALEGGFHSYQETLSEFTNLAAANPSLASLVNLGQSYEGRQIFALKITRDPTVNDPGKADVLITGCHHAREWISVEPPIYFARQLIEGYSTDDFAKYVVDHLQIWIVPIVNPDGLTYSQDSRNDQLDVVRLWRKNRRPISVPGCIGGTGVDLNRNYGYQWRLQGDAPCPFYHDDFGASDDTGDEIYRGPEPNSELEVKALNALTGDPVRNFRARIDYHNFGELVLYPWGYQAAPSSDEGTVSALAQQLSDSMLARGRRFYRPQRAIQLYASTGLGTDYAYGVNNVPVSITIELRPTCCEFNVSESEIAPINQENWEGAKVLLNWAANPPVLQGLNAYQSAPDGSLSKLVYSARWIETNGTRRIALDTRFPRIEPGRLQLRFQFSKPMATDSMPEVTIGRDAPFSELSVVPSALPWQKTLYAGDTWVGEVVIPSESGAGREWRLSVSATDGVGLKLDGKPETVASYAFGTNGWLNYEDSSGFPAVGGADQEHLLPATVRDGELIVLVGSPKGGERLAGGDQYRVSWTTPSTIGYIPDQQEVWISTDAGFLYAPILAGLPGRADSALVTIPQVPTSRALVRVFARGGSLGYTIFGDSEAQFTIGANVGSGVDLAFVSSELIDQGWTDSMALPEGSLSGPLRLAVNVAVTNRGNIPIVNPFMRVFEVTRGNILLSRDVNSFAGASARQSVQAGSDDTLSPGETTVVRMLIGLIKRKKFDLSVQLYGVPAGGNIAASNPVPVWTGKPRSR